LGPQTIADEGTLLAFDFGTRKIGVAVGNTLVRVAHPLTTIRSEARAARFDAIVALIDEWRPQALVVGRPVHADGTPHAVTAQSDGFARSLAGRFGLPVLRVDERFTTQIADASLREAGMRGTARAEARDAMAAQLILQAWFDDNKTDATRDPA
jgi:putative Holliday junction resolvase